MSVYLTLLLIKSGDLIVDKEGIRQDILSWRLGEVKKLASEYDTAFKVLVELLSDSNPHVRANVLAIIEDMIEEGTLTRERLSMVLDEVIRLTKDDDERVALKALEVLNLLLEKEILESEEYERVTQALMEVLKSGIPVLGEYAAEGLGKVGSKVVKLAYRLINWLFSLVGSSKKKEVQSAAITALTEMASKTEDNRVLNEIFDRMSDLLSNPDPYLVERALVSIDRLLSRADKLSMRNKLKAVNAIKALKGDVRLGMKAAVVLEKLEKTANVEEEFQSPVEIRRSMEITQYTVKDIDRLLDAGKTEIVAELAKIDPEVMNRVLNMLTDPDYTRRMDALWIVSKITNHLTPTDAYSILPVLGEFLKSKNPWARETAAKIMADLYTIYPGTSKFFSSIIDVLLKSNKPNDIEGALELLSKLAEKIGSEDFEESAMKVIFKLLDRDDARGVVLRFLAREAQRLIDMDTEALFRLSDKLKELYGKDGGKYDEIIASLLDVITDIVRMRQKGIEINE
jgi:phage terminase small subunit